MTDFDKVYAREIILTEGSMVERLHRSGDVELDPFILHAGLIYTSGGRRQLEKIYRQYADIAQKYKLPMILLAPTWRANPERIAQSTFSEKISSINQDAVQFMSDIRQSYGAYADSILIAGMMACRGDAYKAEEALSEDEAYQFHRIQAKQLAESEIDFIRVATLPAASEAIGLARVLAECKKPYTLSFVVRPNGNLLDGTPLWQLIEKIDSEISPRPLSYTINCVHPSVMATAMESIGTRSISAMERINGFQANTSAKSPEELDGAAELDSAEPEDLAQQIFELQQKYHLKVVGGCCGTDNRHIEALAKKLANA